MAGLFLVGCVVGPSYRSPDSSASDEFDVGPALLPAVLITTPPTTQAVTTQPTPPAPRPVAAPPRPATRLAARPVDLARWWESLDDPELDSLARRAVQANLDVGISVARLQQARALLLSSGASALPPIEASAGAGRGTGTNATRGRTAAPLNAGTDTKRFDQINYVAGFDSTWEIDLFGGVRRSIEAAAAEAQAAEEEHKQVLVSVLAELARSYVELRSFQLRLQIAQENVNALRRTVDLVRVRFNRQIGNELDVVLAERQLSAAQSRIAPLDAAVRQAERRISVLIGDRPESLYGELQKPGRIPAMSADVDVGVPPELVRHRPDIRRAERQVAADTARIGVAIAALFPQISLSAGIGVQGQGLGFSPVSQNLLWSLGPSFRWQLLDFGRLDALVEAQEYRTQQRLLEYRRTVFSAIQEVEDAMTSYAAERNRFAQLSVAVSSSERAVNLATQRYDLGVTDFLNVLDAQRQLYDLQDQLAVSQQAVTTQLIALYKALGGGWESFGSVVPPPAPRPAIIAAGAQAVGAGRRIAPH
jgi:NodT family efflux transporter outer membrane factor (OMF) lipoprotein